MGVYIRGMEIPTRCYACPCADLGYYDCNLMPGTRIEQHKRLDDCPLAPVPPHGRLIDADALTVKLQRHREYHSDDSKSGAAISNGIGQCLDIINGKECPTIIPADHIGDVTTMVTAEEGE